jgi:Ankyrin repeats (3 copies)
MNKLTQLIEAAKQGAVEDVKVLLDSHPELINMKDELGATALHYAAFDGHCAVVHLLVQHGAEINAIDDKFGATPTGWAIEYLREMGGFLAIELDDFAFAIRRKDVDWVSRFLKRFPGLRYASDKQGIPFRLLADQCESPEIKGLFDSDAGNLG